MKILKNITFKNFTSLSFNHGIHILIQVILVPLFLTFWNLETYADWILISTIPALLTVSQFGLFAYGLNMIVIVCKQNKIAFIRLRMSPFTISLFRANEMTVT